MEEKIEVHGPTKVSGVLPVSGAKNSVLKLMAAALLELSSEKREIDARRQQHVLVLQLPM